MAHYRRSECLSRLAEEGLCLVRSAKSNSGYHGVYWAGNRGGCDLYSASLYVPSTTGAPGSKTQTFFGQYGSAAGAALVVARELGPEGCAAAQAAEDAALAKRREDELSAKPEVRQAQAAAAVRQAAAEGLTLVRSSACFSGFYRVNHDSRHTHRKPYFVDQTGSHGKRVKSVYGRYKTAEEGALDVARLLGSKESAAMDYRLNTPAEVLLEQQLEDLQPQRDAALRAAVAEGLTLERAKTDSGFFSVYTWGSKNKQPRGRAMRYTAKVYIGRRAGSGTFENLGVYDTALEAAVAYARGRKEEEDAARALLEGEEDDDGPKGEAELAAERLVAETGLKLFLSAQSSTGYLGVTRASKGGQEQYWARHTSHTIGRYASLIEAAVAYAQHREQIDGDDSQEAKAKAAEKAA